MWGIERAGDHTMREPTVLSVTSPAPRDVWQQLCDDDPTSALSQTPAWTDALVGRTRWQDASRLYAMDDGRQFVLPLARQGPTGAGAVYASLPGGWGMGGCVGSQPLRSEDVAAMVADLQTLKPLRARILPNPLRGDTWQAGVFDQSMALARYSHVLDLEGGFDKVWSERYRRGARRTVGKALSSLEVESDSTGRLIPAYRELFRRSIDRWAERSREPLWLARFREAREDPPGKLEYLAETLGERMVTWVAYFNEEPAAAAITLRGNSYFAWRGAMHEEYGPATHASYLLQNLSIEDACKAGARHYYLGESGKSAGIAMFKERFGAVGFPYPELRMERLPITRANELVAQAVKRLVGYQKH